jgi:hypothetical protein
MSQFYHYEALEPGTIRILHLEPGQVGDALKGQCSIISLATTVPVPYEALSYTWGPATFAESIYLRDTALIITTSLHSALRHVRRTNRITLIWAGAICINQRDDAERSAQVSMIYNIYHKAEMVLTLLGENTDNNLRAIWMMGQLSAAKRFACHTEGLMRRQRLFTQTTSWS